MRGEGPESDLEDFEGASANPGKLPTERFPPVSRAFSSVKEMMNFAQTGPSLWPAEPLSRRRSSKPEHLAFSGTLGWEEACELADAGWSQGRRLLVEAASRAPPVERIKDSATVYDVAGAFPDVPRFVSGDPQCMLDWTASLRGRRTLLRVVICPICDKSVSQERRANWGGALLSWIEAVELSGHIVQIDVIYVSRPAWYIIEDKKLGPYLVVTYPLKRPDQHLPIAELAFWLMHNAAQRRIQFAIRERLPIGKWYAKGRVYGDAVTARDEVMVHCKPEDLLLILGDGASSVTEGLDDIYGSVEDWKRRMLQHRETASESTR